MSAALCCCGICCQEISTACTKLLGSRRVTQLAYVFLLVLFVIPVVLVTYILSTLNKFVNLTPSSVVLRMSFSLFVLFFLMLLFMTCRNRFSQVINEGLFCVKFALLVGFFVGSLFLPSAVLDVYGQISKICSIVYLIMQTIILIDIFYLFGIRLVRRYDDGEGGCAGVLIGFTIIAETLAIFLIVLAFIKFRSDQCGSTTWLSIVTSIILIVIIPVQLLGFNSQNSLFTTSLVSLLIAYTSFIAQEYFKDGCKVRLTALGYAIDVVVCLVLFALTTYGTLRGGFSEHEYDAIQQNQYNHPNQPNPFNQVNPKSLANPKPIQVQADTIVEYSQGWGWIRWHLFMCLGVMYLGMIFSNWQSTDQIGQNLQGSDFVFWLRTSQSWFTGLIYIWAMIAPQIFPERDFRIE